MFTKHVTVRDSLHIRLSIIFLLPATGYKNYVGFLYLEYTYNNPVVNVFVQQLGKNKFTKDSGAPPIPKLRSEASESDPEASGKPACIQEFSTG